MVRLHFVVEGQTMVPAYANEKTTAGPLVAETIGLPSMRQKCPHFNQWLTRLESLASK